MTNTSNHTRALLTDTSKTPLTAAPLLPALDDRPVTRTVSTTYQTVEIDAGALDWAAMNRAQVRTVLNVAGAKGAALGKDGRLNTDGLTLPLRHPALLGILDDYEILDAAREGTRAEVTRTTRATVPVWFDPNSDEPESAQREAAERTLYPNDATEYDAGEYALTTEKTNTCKPAALLPVTHQRKTRWSHRRAPSTVNTA